MHSLISMFNVQSPIEQRFVPPPSGPPPRTSVSSNARGLPHPPIQSSAPRVPPSAPRVSPSSARVPPSNLQSHLPNHSANSLPARPPLPQRGPSKEEKEAEIRSKLSAKLSAHVNLLEKEHQTQMKPLLEEQASMKEGKLLIQATISSLEEEKVRLKQEIERTKKEVHDLDAKTSKLQQTEISIDDAFRLGDEQLADCVASDNAIGDCLYYLGKALAENLIDLDLFLAECRKLARNQFFERALAQKIADNKTSRK